MANNNWLKKYTSFEYLKGIVRENKLYLASETDRKCWDDENDKALIKIYEKKKKCRVRITCLTSAPDRYHFWKIYADPSPRNQGVCLWFDKSGFTSDVENDATVCGKLVRYKNLSNLAPDFQVSLLPFLKRDQFRSESEFRVLRQSSCDASQDTNNFFSFSPNSLKRIYLSPWTPVEKGNAQKRKIANWLAGDQDHICVKHNRTLNYEKWISEAKRLSYKKNAPQFPTRRLIS
jgi:hypothetical protein